MTINLKYFGLGDYVSVGGFHGLCRGCRALFVIPHLILFYSKFFF